MHYEMVVLVKKDTDRQAFTEKLNLLLQKDGFTMVGDIAWERRLLAYPIKKQTEAFFGSLLFDGGLGTNPTVLTEKFKLEEAVLRHLVLKADKPRKEKKKKEIPKLK